MIKRNFPFFFYLFTGLFFTTCKQVEKNRLSPGYEVADTAMVTTLLNKSASFTQTILDSQQYYAAEALKLSQSIHFAKGTARAKALQSGACSSQGNYTDAVSLALQAIHLYDSLGMTTKKINMTLGLAHIYKDMGGEKGYMEYM